jgi:hypothetical protein
MRIAACAFGALVMLGACATAPSGDGAEVAEKKVCKAMRTTGSNMPTNVCRTEAEWAAFKKAGQESVEEFERDRSNSGSPTATN